MGNIALKKCFLGRAEDMKKYLASYSHNGSRWSFEFNADDFEDANARLEQIKAFSVLDGELKLKIPASSNKIIQNIIGKLMDFFIWIGKN